MLHSKVLNNYEERAIFEGLGIGSEPKARVCPPTSLK